MKQTQQENNTLKSKLQEMLEAERNTIKGEVIEEALEYDSDEEIKCFFSDLLQHGCVSGMIGKLVYYTDTQRLSIISCK